MTIMETLRELRARDFKTLTHDERAVIIAHEAIDGLYTEVISETGPFGSIAKCARHLGIEPANLARTMGQERTRRMSAWLFGAVCNAVGVSSIASSSVDALREVPNLTLEGFIVIRRIGGELSDAVEIMGRQG